MTSGTKDYSNISEYSLKGYPGSVFAGSFSTKSWSGGDGNRKDFHPYSFTKQVGRYALTTVDVKNGDKWQPYMLTLSSGNFNPYLFDYNELDQRRQALDKLISDLQGGVDMINAMAEFDETCSFVSSSAIKAGAAAKYLDLASLKDKIRSSYGGVGTFKKALRHPMRKIRKLADAWLTFAFGICPLVNDVGSVVNKAVNMPLNRTLTFQATVAYDKVMKSRHYTHSLKCSTRLKTKVSVRKFMELYENIVPLNPFDLARVMWERTGFSWLADYFLNIGATLGRLSASISVLPDVVHETIRYQDSSVAGSSMSLPFRNTVHGNAYKTNIYYIRRLLDTSVVGLLAMHDVSGLQRAMSLRHATNAISALVQKLTRR